MATDDLLTVPDVAARLRVADETVREWLRSEQISGYNFGGRTGWRIPASEVERLLASKAGKRRPVASRESPRHGAKPRRETPRPEGRDG